MVLVEQQTLGKETMKYRVDWDTYQEVSPKTIMEGPIIAIRFAEGKIKDLERWARWEESDLGPIIGSASAITTRKYLGRWVDALEQAKGTVTDNSSRWFGIKNMLIQEGIGNIFTSEKESGDMSNNLLIEGKGKIVLAASLPDN